MPPDHADFIERLRERNAQPERAAEIDRALWDELGREVTILVTDMSGFTRITRKRGILHFLAMHVRSLELATPLIEAHGGTLVKREADNMICVFDAVGPALEAAAAMHAALAEQNATLADADSHLQFCIGIGHGPVMLLADDIFGDEVNVAYKLGEDIAAAGQTLVSEAAGELAPEGAPLGARQAVELGKVTLGFYPVEGGKPCSSR